MNDSGAKSDVQNFIAGGGRVIMSFGGADGQYLESACSSTAMYNLIKNVIDTQKIYNLDFDIEGGQLDQTEPQYYAQHGTEAVTGHLPEPLRVLHFAGRSGRPAVRCHDPSEERQGGER